MVIFKAGLAKLPATMNASSIHFYKLASVLLKTPEWKRLSPKPHQL